MLSGELLSFSEQVLRCGFMVHPVLRAFIIVLGAGVVRLATLERVVPPFIAELTARYGYGHVRRHVCRLVYAHVCAGMCTNMVWTCVETCIQTCTQALYKHVYRHA